MRKGFGTARFGLVVALALAATGVCAEPSIRGSKARVVSTPSASGRPAQPDAGYFVPYVTGPGGQRIPVMQVPGSVTVVPRQLMDDQQDITLCQALRNVSGVTVGR